MNDLAATLLGRLLGPDAPPFALLRRQDGPGVELLLGDLVDVPRLADIPLPDPEPGVPRYDVLALVPFRQVTELGYACHDDGTPLRCLRVKLRAVLDPRAVLAVLPDQPVEVSGGDFDVDDETYAATVKRVITDEIGRGEGANFVVRRDFRGTVAGAAPTVALTLFRRLLGNETGAYWTFAVHAGDLTLVGATPERHVTARGGTVLMNPISGTYRYPPGGPDVEELLAFLADQKETEELYMVVDEELKQMSAVGDLGGQVLGPYLKEMGHLAHTEYLLAGRSSLDVRDIVRGTMFAATVTGSPVENACRVIARHEPSGRGYYAGVLALFGQDAHGQRTLDAPILIRTLYLRLDGPGRCAFTLPVGATLVRHSDPESEVAETHAKAAGVLAALGVRRPEPAGAGQRLADDPRVAGALLARNATLARFWLEPQDSGVALAPELVGRSALIVDAEDGWTAMLAHLLRRLGLRVDVRRWSAAGDPDGYELLVAGPGPGDPRDLTQPRMAALRALLERRLAARRPLLAVCLSHQILAGLLGLPVVAKESPYQGTQREIDLFGRRVRVGFYNTFTARATGPVPGIEVSADPKTGEVHALRGAGFASTQFHLESVLSTHGVEILRDLLGRLLA
ncbi:2-Amino-2-deoxy-isochorismate synthase [Carbonactinospora thermoautotrophica]|uniref:anthranilate synthase n=2 Tax=Carbonactinospora thermoautotrophica TaxID=1469144 RepID=A0A132MWB0_9ACTN|nr:anthranilate synthase family protein [Carbonactinospora thermoautotrophica]KWX01652.1 2-Amino-2-deoxy-isochorismate synthase [Carbonactinospora thermoautotrophica]